MYCCLDCIYAFGSAALLFRADELKVPKKAILKSYLNIIVRFKRVGGSASAHQYSRIVILYN